MEWPWYQQIIMWINQVINLTYFPLQQYPNLTLSNSLDLISRSIVNYEARYKKTKFLYGLTKNKYITFNDI